jgi:hypothetical protein
MYMKNTHFHSLLFNRWREDDPIVGSKLVALCNNKSPFVVFDGFFYIYFTNTTEWPLLRFLSPHLNFTKLWHDVFVYISYRFLWKYFSDFYNFLPKYSQDSVLYVIVSCSTKFVIAYILFKQFLDCLDVPYWITILWTFWPPVLTVGTVSWTHRTIYLAVSLFLLNMWKTRFN